MKRFLLASVAVMAMAPAAMAADYDAPPPPYPSLPPQISWDGFHIGGSFGGVFGLPGLADGCQTPDAYDVSPEPVAPLTDAGAANVYEYSPTQIDNAFCRSETSGDSSGFAAGILKPLELADQVVDGPDLAGLDGPQQSHLEIDLF